MKTQLMLLASLAFALGSTEAFAAPNETTISGDTAVQLCQAFNAKNGDRGTHWWCDFKCGNHNCHVSCVLNSCTLNVSVRQGSSSILRPTIVPKPPAPPSSDASASHGNGTLATTTKGGNSTVSGGATSSASSSSAVSKSAGFSTGKSGGGVKIQ